MRAWSFSLGRLFGVDVRLHALVPLALSFCVLWASLLGRPGSRGVALWLLLVGAVLTRETARALVLAWCGQPVRTLLLLPTGGLLEMRPTEPASSEPGDRRMVTLAGPVASFLAGLLIAGVAVTMAPEVDLLGQRWISPDHLLRSAVWINLLMGAINLLPAWPLDGGRQLEAEMGGETDRSRSARTTMGMLVNPGAGTARRLIGFTLAVTMVVAGVITTNWWLLAAGMTVLLFSQARRQGLLTGSEALNGTTVGDVMLTDFSVLSASATLEDALIHARHTHEDVFPVVRGSAIVGAVSRQAVLEAVDASGNSYVQGTMARSFQTAATSEPLGAAMARMRRAGDAMTSTLVPVLEGDRVVGVLTPEHLERSLALVSRERARRNAARLVEGR